MFMNVRLQIGMFFTLCTVYVAQSMELAVKDHLDKLKDTNPREILPYLSSIELPQQMTIFDKLTGCNISELYEKLPEEMLLEIGRNLEGEAREYERQYLLMQPIIEDHTSHNADYFKEADPRFALKKKTAVRIDLRSWDPNVRQERLGFNGTTIAVARCLFEGCQFKHLHTELRILFSSLPGKVDVLKKIYFKESPEQYAKGYLASQEITVDSHLKSSLPELTVDAIMGDTLKNISIYTGTTFNHDFTHRYIRSYELEPTCTSKSFAEALCHFMVNAIQKVNIERVVRAEQLYKERNTPHDMITTLYVIASNNLSYKQNEKLHALLTLSKKFGSIQPFPKEYVETMDSSSLVAQKVAHTWGFRTEDEIRNLNIKYLIGVEESYAEYGASSDVIHTLHKLARTLSHDENIQLHKLLSLSKKFGSIRAIPKNYVPKMRSWPREALELVHTWGFRTEAEVRELNIEHVAKTEELYKECGAPSDVIDTLYKLAHTLSYNENYQLHSLLALSKQFGVIQPCPKKYMKEMNSFSCLTKIVANTWGFRTEDEIKNLNIEHVIGAEEFYKKCGANDYIINTLYELARTLSYDENVQLHELLSLSKKFGSIQPFPKAYMEAMDSFSLVAQTVAYIWGFRTEDEIKKLNVKHVVKAEALYEKLGANDDIIDTLYKLARTLPYDENIRLHELLSLSKKFGSIQSFPEGYLPELFSWPLEAQELVHMWGFRAEEAMSSSTCVVS
jgi:hypothetical protein